jgi:glycosyltransferase involved in cell wall biosynthesis
LINNKTIAVVVPCYNEETQIELVVKNMPEFVDRIVVVNDLSKDKTEDVVKSLIKNKSYNSTTEINPKRVIPNPYNRAEQILEKVNDEEIKFYTPQKTEESKSKIVLINHTQNGGVGAAIASGYKWCKDNQVDCTAVMAGDGQMDPNELDSICRPVIEEGVDYVKGNRLIHRSALLVIPKIRYFGNSILSILTKLASGYWHVSDTQTGYTAISNKALNAVRIHKIYKSYGMPNDLLVKLNIAFCTLREVEIKPVYNVGEQSKMKIFKVIPKVSFLLLKSFFKRLWGKYLFRDFHPLFLLYNLAFILFGFSIPFAIKIFSKLYFSEELNPFTFLAFLFLFITGFQAFLFAMWMDIQDNERLYK